MFICLIISLLFNVKSQTSPLYQKHFGFEQFLNPAITGRDKSPIVNISHKRYWLGTKDAPNTTSLGASMRLGSFDFYNPKKMLNRSHITSKNRMGFGGLFIQDNDGPLKSYLAAVTYSYFIPITYNYSELSLGISAEFLTFNINRSMLDPLQPNDPKLLNIKASKIVPESGAGVFYHDLQFYAGISVNDLILSERPYNSNSSTNLRDYFFQAGYKIFLKRFEMEPSIYMAKIDNNSLYFYNQLKFYYMNYNWFVIGYKSTNSILASLGFSLNRFYFAYVFEQNISEMGSYFHGAHEIMLGINIGLYEPQGLRKRVYN